MGYDLQIGSDLMRNRHAAGTLFFRKVASERPSALVVCVAPEKWDTITLLNHSESVKIVVEKAIKDAWPPGIQRQEKQEVFGHTVHDIKMNDFNSVTFISQRNTISQLFVSLATPEIIG